MREFQPLPRFGFRVHDGKGGEFVPASVIQLTRDMTYSDAEILARSRRSSCSSSDMRTDMVSRSYASSLPPPPAPRVE